jgi:hypothetical protein
MKYLNYLKSFGKGFSYQTWLFLTITCMIACNNKGTGGNNNDSAAIAQNADTTKKQLNALVGTSEFSYLSIAASVLENIFITPPAQGGLNSRKIVFRFTYNGGADDKIVLTGFPTKPGNNNYLAPFDPVPEPYARNLANQKIYLSDLELEKKFFKDSIWSKKGANTHLILIPFVHTSGTFQYCVNYSLNWITLPGYTGQTFAPGDELNPSPPADPK